MQYLIISKLREQKTAHIQLNRLEALNALNPELMNELGNALIELDKDLEIRAIVLSGDDKAFAAGADIRQMADKGAMEMVALDQFAIWDEIPKIKKPVIAAVSGFALGGGCELAMMCDMIIASETAQFGQPEIKLGVIPGAGGTQRFTLALGKQRAMELILTGGYLSAKDAMRAGLVNRVFPVENYLEEALKIAAYIATMPALAVQLAKESILSAFETPLREGLRLERKNFYMLFDTPEQKEGMTAFLEKRKPNFE